MTSLVDTLVRRGLVTRLPHPDDRRMLLIDITAAGRALVDVILPVTHRINEEVFAGFSERERGQLIELMARLQQRLAVMRDEPAPDGAPPPRLKAGRHPARI